MHLAKMNKSDSVRARAGQLSAEEQKAIVTGFENPSSLQASGVRLAGQKFFTLQANDRSIYGKKAVRAHSCSRIRCV